MKHTGDYELDRINMLEQECSDLEEENKRLEEENKNLKDKIEHLEFDIEAWKKLKAVWEKKEHKLQIEIWWLMWERDGLQMVVERLHKEIEEQDKEVERLQKVLYTITWSRDDGEPDLYEDVEWDLC